MTAAVSIRRLALGLLAAMMPVLAAGEDLQAPLANTAAELPLSVELVKTGLYLIDGGGSNSLLRLSASGSILVDGKLPGTYRPLMSQVRRISRLSDLPVRVLIVTDHHAHHAGNHAQFVAAGMAVLMQQNAESRLPAVAAGAASMPKPPAPTITFDRAYRLRMGGVEVRVFHFGNAHTDNDAVVLFPDLKVVAVGDLMSPGAPAPDFAAGGSLLGWVAVLEQVLKLDFDIVVPSSGQLATRADLLAFKTRLEILVSRASALTSEGVSRDEWPARLKTDDLGERTSFTDEQLDGLRAELAQGRQSAIEGLTDAQSPHRQPAVHRGSP